ncbi:hypothetical protein B0T18DRAFT_490836 [Schizothecium vesticola]|uniref:Calpain catalytic domain-containing protein n=1 Tax=Schizothecium vesticola TaxID=314040 RepID=A0AA40EH76_9PEZI|nr:hypothetical protein B0T18DRAFT_490836 [Schizothecium vesticola]
MADKRESVARFRRLSDAGEQGDDDSVGLLRPLRKKSKWKARLLGHRFDAAGTDGAQASPSSSQTFPDAPVLGKIGNITISGLQGTNSDAPGLANFTEASGFSFTAPPAGGTFGRTPVTPIPQEDVCKGKYQYKSQLGFDGTAPLGDLIQLNGRIDREDVIQGPLGDCGFIAAILAMICSGREDQLKAIITRVGSELEVRFRSPIKDPSTPSSSKISAYRTDLFVMDDAIPFLSDDQLQTQGCWKFLAAYPGNGPGATPNDTTRPVMFVPLLEKAWAIYANANPALLHPDNLQNPSLVGYPGIAGTSQHVALQAMTGLDGEVRFRSGPGAGIIGNIIRLCLVRNCPMSVGTVRNATELLDLGPKDANGNITTEIGIISTNPTLHPNGMKYLIDVTEKDTGRTITLVHSHAYAVDNENSNDVEVVLINPWGKNPDRKGDTSLGGSLRIRLDTLDFVMAGIGFVSPPGF